MPSLKEIKTRIGSVNSTRKITSAMKMVASSKLHHAQRMIENMYPYSMMLKGMLKTFLQSDVEVDSELTLKRPVKRVALIVFSSNSSLCGGYNHNVIKLTEQVLKEYEGLGPDNILIYPIGRKIGEKVTKWGLKSAGKFVTLADKPNAQQCADIARELSAMYVNGEIDRVEIIFHHFKSAGSQILTRETLLPFDIERELDKNIYRDLDSTIATKDSQEYLRQRDAQQKEQKIEAFRMHDNYIVEPDKQTLLNALIPKVLNLQVYVDLLDSNASEHAARMVAMQTATDNADELLRLLNLQYNKSRQQAITSELLDIVGGSINN
ncbi:MAG: F0F1 ATP synthase subunit gamma [Bacteroidaceae bacterium]|nr:F0F1 ATP synthase subunit gamma [Bacteroidaceae bacterium]